MPVPVKGINIRAWKSQEFGYFIDATMAVRCLMGTDNVITKGPELIDARSKASSKVVKFLDDPAVTHGPLIQEGAPSPPLDRMTYVYKAHTGHPVRILSMSGLRLLIEKLNGASVDQNRPKLMKLLDEWEKSGHYTATGKRPREAPAIGMSDMQEQEWKKMREDFQLVRVETSGVKTAICSKVDTVAGGLQTTICSKVDTVAGGLQTTICSKVDTVAAKTAELNAKLGKGFEVFSHSNDFLRGKNDKQTIALAKVNKKLDEEREWSRKTIGEDLKTTKEELAYLKIALNKQNAMQIKLFNSIKDLQADISELRSGRVGNPDVHLDAP
jgi:hypothetical protein